MGLREFYNCTEEQTNLLLVHDVRVHHFETFLCFCGAQIFTFFKPQLTNLYLLQFDAV